MKHEALSGMFRSLTIILLSILAIPSLGGTVITETRNPGDFTEIDLSGAYKVTLVAGTACSVKLEGEAEDLQVIKTIVSGKELEVSMKNNTNLSGSVHVTITYVKLESIDCSGTVTLTAEQPVKASNFELDLSGTGRVEMTVETTELKLDISGTGNVVLKGNATKVEVDISGAGKLVASEMQTETCKVEISGVGNAEIKVSKSLDAEISGTGNVKYYGNPTVQQSVSGTGKVVKM